MIKYTSQKQKLNEINASDILLEVDDDNRKNIQNSLLEMFLDIQEVCLHNHIMVYLCSGSALGAVRHKGFIPWDDDIDISMTRSGFDKFSKIFKKELSERYILNAPNISQHAKSRFPKIMKKGTVFREVGDMSDGDNCGLFIDVFIIDNVPDRRLHRMIKGSLCNVLEFIGGQVALVETESDEWRTLYKRTGKINYTIRYFCGKIFSFRSASNWYGLIDRIIQYHNCKTKYCTLATGINHYFGETMERADLTPARKITFEGHKAFVFNKVETYLSKLYGPDFMIPPAPEKRQKHFITELSI